MNLSDFFLLNGNDSESNFHIFVIIIILLSFNFDLILSNYPLYDLHPRSFFCRMVSATSADLDLSMTLENSPTQL